MEQLDKKTNKKDKKSFVNRIFNKKKLSKPQRVAVLFMRKNGVAQPYEVESKKGFFSIDDGTYHVDKDCRYNLVLGSERIPLFVQYEEGLTPEPTHEYYQKFRDLEDFQNRVAESQNMSIRAIRHAELVRSEGRDGPKMKPKTVIAIAILLIIAFAIFRSYA